MKQWYRILVVRMGVVEDTYEPFVIEERSRKLCNKMARKHFNSVKSDPKNAFEGLRLFRILAPARAERIVFLESNGLQEDNRKWYSYKELSSEVRTVY